MANTLRVTHVGKKMKKERFACLAFMLYDTRYGSICDWTKDLSRLRYHSADISWKGNGIRRKYQDWIMNSDFGSLFKRDGDYIYCELGLTPYDKYKNLIAVAVLRVAEEAPLAIINLVRMTRWKRNLNPTALLLAAMNPAFLIGNSGHSSFTGLTALKGAFSADNLIGGNIIKDTILAQATTTDYLRSIGSNTEPYGTLRNHYEEGKPWEYFTNE